jgi:hypothetical protein
VKEGKKGKSQGIEGSANANDVWGMDEATHRICTIGKCDLLSFFRLIESLPATCKSHPLFSFLSLKHGGFQMRFHLFCFSILAPLFLFEDPSFC